MELILHEPIKKSDMMSLFLIRSCSYRFIGIWCLITLLVKIGSVPVPVGTLRKLELSHPNMT